MLLLIKSYALLSDFGVQSIARISIGLFNGIAEFCAD